MALGGGIFATQNKVLPGTYINFVSASAASATLSERGIATMPFEFTMGGTGKVYTVTKEDFLKNSKSIFGYDYTAPELKGVRDLFKHIHTLHAYNLDRIGAVRANSDVTMMPSTVTAKFPGPDGNNIKVKLESVGGEIIFTTYYKGEVVDTASLRVDGKYENDYVTLDVVTGATHEFRGECQLSGGDDGEISGEAYQKYLDAIESYSFNTIGTISTNKTVKALFAEWTKRMRDTIGVKFQCVLYKYADADYEGIISVENKLVGESTESGNAVYWVVGACAGCAINKSLINAVYDGEYDIDVAYTQTQLEEAVKDGKFIFHRVNDTVRVLDDINTFVSFTENKSEDFASNQTIRVIDQVGNDIASLYNEKYLGKIQNNDSGRISLWNDIVKHHQELERTGAIENFDPEKVIVSKGDSKKAVVINDAITPVNAMAQLYMTTIVE